MKVIARETKIIDASGKSMGRLATEVVGLLMGKGKPSFVPNVDGGDHVRVVNASKMKLTGKKMEQKSYYRHTTYATGLRVTPMSRVWAKDPGEVLKKAVSRMLPKNSHRKERLIRFDVKN